MASELQETLARIVTKSKVLVDKYHVLNAEKERLEQVVAQLQSEIANTETNKSRIMR
jgi:predicted  nucleic acid-binding Zn-ribbon protein